MKETLHIYTRVSSQTQVDDGTSIDTQQDAGKKIAESLGFKYQIWNEGGKSSHYEELHRRPKFAALLQEIEKGKVKHLYAWEFDRLSRNEDISHVIRQRMWKHNVTLYLKTGKYDFADKTTRLLMGILGQFANYENALRVERSRAGKLRRVREGFWLGGPPPFGYRIEDKKLVINKDESKWVIKMFRWYMDGDSVELIRNRLMKHGVLSRRRKAIWSTGSIDALLKNTHYDGYFEYHDKHYDEKIRVTCPRIVEASIYSAVVKLRKARSYRTDNKRAGSGGKAVHTYLLTPFLRCAHCGSPYHGHMKETQTSYYFCSRKYRIRKADEDETYKCDTYRNVRIDATDTLVWQSVLDVVKNSHLFREGIKTQVLGNRLTDDEIASKKRELQNQIKRLDKDIDALSDSIANLNADVVMGSASEDAAKIVDVLNKRREEVALRKREILDELESKSKGEQFVDWVLEFRDRMGNLDALSIEKRQEFLRGVVKEVVVESVDKQNHNLKLVFNFPFVDDTLTWNDPKRKSKGYVLGDGKKTKVIATDGLKKSTKERRPYPKGVKRPNRTLTNKLKRDQEAS